MYAGVETYRRQDDKHETDIGLSHAWILPPVLARKVPSGQLERVGAHIDQIVKSE